MDIFCRWQSQRTFSGNQWYSFIKVYSCLLFSQMFRKLLREANSQDQSYRWFCSRWKQNLSNHHWSGPRKVTNMDYAWSPWLVCKKGLLSLLVSLLAHCSLIIYNILGHFTDWSSTLICWRNIRLSFIVFYDFLFTSIYS